jgi:hypothetical protein
MHSKQFSNRQLRAEWRGLKEQPTYVKVGLALFLTVVLICAVLVAVPLWEGLVGS